jgi:hypothetical protein
MIRFLDEQQPESTTVAFVGGTREGERDTLEDRPAEIQLRDGTHVRSVQCADDRALRYVWRPRESSGAPQRDERPSIT